MSSQPASADLGGPLRESAAMAASWLGYRMKPERKQTFEPHATTNQPTRCHCELGPGRLPRKHVNNITHTAPPLRWPLVGGTTRRPGRRGQERRSPNQANQPAYDQPHAPLDADTQTDNDELKVGNLHTKRHTAPQQPLLAETVGNPTQRESEKRACGRVSHARRSISAVLNGAAVYIRDWTQPAGESLRPEPKRSSKASWLSIPTEETAPGASSRAAQ